ncbi:hypothetical protein [Gordonia sp. N1V]|uniref:hypothetical protein n=1 Tax=Gordonia sp. N1V TaxID=3034163 RepID=UPI0023E2DB92|nr:hypothetical protein [Gordonia sp. N1V]MDF3280455.1 hypothetical protein [Gordonia sp. N1V]
MGNLSIHSGSPLDIEVDNFDEVVIDEMYWLTVDEAEALAEGILRAVTLVRGRRHSKPADGGESR